MIKITRFLYVHFLVFPLFILSYFVGSIHTMIMAYAIVTVHEVFHLFAALLLGVRTASIMIMPFGMTLRLSGNVIKEPLKESLVALSGPLANAIMIVLGYIARHFYLWAEESLFLYWTLNWVIMLLNLLPILPLDGGRVLRAVLTHVFGYLAGMKIIRTMTLTLTVILAVFGILVLAVTRFNVSLLLASAFLFLYFIEDKKRGDLFVLKELLRSKERLIEKGLMKSKFLAATEHTKAKSVLPKISYDCFHLIYISGKRGRIISEAELIDALMIKGYSVEMKDIR
ncbi:MAG: hypothetical protein IJA08_02550 [Clostridia bacterium]|nr:hypothetical protein [Clostridia bacterium]